MCTRTYSYAHNKWPVILRLIIRRFLLHSCYADGINAAILPVMSPPKVSTNEEGESVKSEILMIMSPPDLIRRPSGGKR